MNPIMSACGTTSCGTEMDKPAPTVGGGHRHSPAVTPQPDDALPFLRAAHRLTAAGFVPLVAGGVVTVFDHFDRSGGKKN